MIDPARAEETDTPIERWRLVLGDASTEQLGPATGERLAMDSALQWLYGREGDLAGRDVRNDRTAGGALPMLSTPEWLDEIHRLFPAETIERLEQDALERYEILDLVTRPDVLERIEPSQTLLRAVLRTKHLMNPDVLMLARRLVQQVVAELLDKLSTHFRQSFSGARNRRRTSIHRQARNLDLPRTLRASLKHYDPEERRIAVVDPKFFSRAQRHLDRWQVILLVDQSGSMAGSVIHSAVTAACLWDLPGIKTHLIAFDTEIVDLTSDVDDPVELLLRVQLGGGTDIARAVAYGSRLVEHPRRTIMVLITDFFEGGDSHALEREVRALCEQGVIVLGLAALDDEASPIYDRDQAQRLANVGAQVGAMTPAMLAEFLAEHIGG